MKARFAVIPLLLTSRFICTLTPIHGRSMSPTLNPLETTRADSDVVVVEKLTAAVDPRRFNRGEVVVFVHPDDPELVLVKRITKVVDEGYVWVEGDEPFKSTDSRVFGPVAKGLIIGRVIGIMWPLDRFKLFL